LPGTDPFFGVEVFENLVEFRSLALPKTAYAYEMPLREKLITFADACDEKDIEDTRAFYLVVEICEMCWLRKVVVTHDKLLVEERLEVEDLFSFDKPEEAIDHAVYVEGKLYLKTLSQILVANEGVVPLPKGLKFTVQPRLLRKTRPEVPGRAGGRHPRRRCPEQTSHA